jgi:solute:Na+ symporter, SSS family
MDGAAAEVIVGSFSIADMAVVIGYLLAMVFVGIWMSRGQKSTRDYFLGGRDIPWWAVGLAIIATETSALTFIGVPAMAFGAMSRDAAGKLVFGQGSIGFLQIIIGYVIARVIVAVMMVPHYFKGDVYSPYQVLMKNFGKKTRYLASVFFLIGGSMGAGVRIYVTAIPVMILFQVFFPWWNLAYSILLFTVISIIYTYVGGIKAVVWTDVIQFSIFVIGGAFALFYIPTLIEGGWGRVMEIGRETNRLEWICSGFASEKDAIEAAGGGFLSYIVAHLKEIIGGKFNIWMGLIGATIGVMCSHGVDQLNVQRVLTCRNAKEGGKALILSAILIFPMFLMFLFVGVALYAYYSTNGFNFGINPWDPAKEIFNEAGKLIAPYPKPKADFIFPIFIITKVPAILKGFLIAGILAAAMSSISGALSALGSVAVMDIYREIDGNRKSEKQYLKLSKLAIIGVSVLLVAIAFLSQYADLVFNLAFTLAGLTSGALLGAVLFAIWYKRCYPGPIIAGMISSVVVMIIIVVSTQAGMFKMNWPWFTPIGTAVTLIVAYLAAIGVPKPEKDFAEDIEPYKPTH